MSDNVTPIGGRLGEWLVGWSTREQLARKANVSTHTIRRWERQGLEVVRRGNMRLYNDERTQKWLLGELDSSPRKPGRPSRRG